MFPSPSSTWAADGRCIASRATWSKASPQLGVPCRNRSACRWPQWHGDGYLTRDGRRTDAVFVEASEAGSDVSVIMAQRYTAVGTIRKRMERVGNAAVVDYGSALF